MDPNIKKRSSMAIKMICAALEGQASITSNDTIFGVAGQPVLVVVHRLEKSLCIEVSMNKRGGRRDQTAFNEKQYDGFRFFDMVQILKTIVFLVKNGRKVDELSRDSSGDRTE